ncbi:MAG: ribosome small subunit-dependent GTPase A [Clostridiales bacterium]|nr:ribosome small subunit-dependent GTPase A [Clostridiales bacterium]
MTEMTGRIIKGVGGLYTVVTEEGRLYKGKARGILRKQGKKPYIGDFALITSPEEGECIIEDLIERKNSLIRPRAANIDCALIVFAAAEPELNLDLLDRFLIFAESRNIPEIRIVLNKCDIGSTEVINKLESIYKNIYRLHFVCGKSGGGIEELKQGLKNKVSVFAGPSGVGKSTIVNALTEEGLMETGEISGKIKRGRHTTRHVELLQMFKNTYIVDSPGFTSLDTALLKDENIAELFREFKPYSEGCRFRNCRHIEEPDCKLKEQVGVNISPERYNRYKKIIQELKEVKF